MINESIDGPQMAMNGRVREQMDGLLRGRFLSPASVESQALYLMKDEQRLAIMESLIDDSTAGAIESVVE